MDIFLQVWGGVCYLLNKIFLSWAEGARNNKRWRVRGWTIYLIGLPAWIIILIVKQNWIAVAIEAGGAPAMILGLVVALKGLKNAPKWLSKGAEIFVYISLAFGIAYSVHDFRGITTITQAFEIGVMAGFLIGSYLLANNNPAGWLWFMLMNASMGALMAIQTKPILAIQQMLSLGFVIRGFIQSRQKAKVNNT